MSSIRVSGNTSGHYDLTVPDVAGSNTIALDKIVVTDSNGNVGIGTTSPVYKLHVNSGATNVVADFESTDGIAGIRLRDNSGNVELSASGNDFRVQPAGSTAEFVVKNGGNVGIGTLTPNSKLDVYSTTDSWTRISVRDATSSAFTGVYRQSGTVSAGIFAHNSALNAWEDLWINAHNDGSGGVGGGTSKKVIIGGNVGIGTTNPGARLSFGDYIPSNGQTLHTYQSNNTVSGLGVVSGEHRMFTNDGSILSYGHVSTSDGSTYTERMKIDSSGTLNVISSDVVLGGGAGSNTASYTTAANSSDFKRFETDGAHFNSSVFSDPAIMGPNKLCVYDESTWKGGIGLGSGEMQYYTGNAQSFYKHTGSALTKHMEITGDGEVTTPQQPHIFGTPHTGTEASSGQATIFRVKTSRGGLSFSNSRVTVPVAGVYMITYQTICQTNVGRYDTHIKINGTNANNGLNETNGDGYHQRTHVFNMYLNANDYITWHNSRYYSDGSTFDPWTNASVTLLG